LFLDVDQLTPAGQNELLAFFRLPTFHLRTLVTSRRPLLEVADEGRFDHELALALITLVIELPALASRRQDIPVLAQQFVEECNATGHKQLSGFTVEALDRLGALPWNRDVDELSEVVEQACRSAEGPWITESELPKRVELLTSAAAHPAHVDEIVQLDDFLVEIERELIQRAMNRAKGNKAQAARLLGIHRARLLRRLSQLADGDVRSDGVME
jgi:DNA-binding NtrC family response regulator